MSVEVPGAAAHTQASSAREADTAHLVVRAAAGDRDAFALLVEERVDRAHRIASGIIGNPADARDVVQDAFIAVWRMLPRLRDPSRFDAWLNQIVRNRCRDVLRRRRRSREAELVNHQVAIADPAGDLAERLVIDAAFDRLRVDQRQILIMHHVEHLPIRDLAVLLGVPDGTAKWRLHAARQALQRALESER